MKEEKKKDKARKIKEGFGKRRLGRIGVSPGSSRNIPFGQLIRDEGFPWRLPSDFIGHVPEGTNSQVKASLSSLRKIARTDMQGSGNGVRISLNE